MLAVSERVGLQVVEQQADNQSVPLLVGKLERSDPVRVGDVRDDAPRPFPGHPGDEWLDRSWVPDSHFV